MTPSPRERLREILAGPPRQERFRELLSLFGRWPAGAERDEALQEAEQGLSPWPPEVRRGDVGSSWLFGEGSAVAPWARLMRAPDVRRVDQLAYRFTALMGGGPAPRGKAAVHGHHRL